MRVTGTVLILTLTAVPLSAQDAPASDSMEVPLARIVKTLQKSATRTLGGKQFWSDVRFFRGWRIQKNVFTGHCRLLDSEHHRCAHGTLEECEAALLRIREEQQLEPMTGRAVILIHGLIRSSGSFNSMARHLNDDGCTVVPFDYPSTRSPIPAAADCLNQVIESLEGIDTIDVVGHSMGGLVLRCYLRDYGDDRMRRAVMLGVPNHGARMADQMHNYVLFRMLYGPAGQQLVSDEEGLIADLPVPDFEFGVIAGGRGNAKGYNPLLSGDNDSTVTVRSARLSGASDFLLVPVIHSFLMTDRRCIAAVESFLDQGRFDVEREPQRIP